MLLLPLAVLAQSPSTSHEPEVTDPEGDAYDQSLPVAGSAGPTVRKAAPAADLRFVDFSETPESLVVELGVASLTAAFDGAVASEENLRTVYAVRWNALQGARAGARTLSFEVQESRGAPVYSTEFLVRHTNGGCTGLNYCRWQVPVEVVPGSPGVIRWNVPRILLPTEDEGRVSQPYAFILQSRNEGPAHYSTTVAPPCNPDAPYTCPPHDENSHRQVLTDRADPGRDFIFTVPAAATPFTSTQGPFSIDDPAGDQFGSKSRSDNDIVGLLLHEDARDFLLDVKVARVDEAPGDMWVGVLVAFGPDRTYSASLRVEGGIRRWSGAYVVPDDNAPKPVWRPFPAMLTILDDEDILRITFPRAAMGTIRVGDVATQVSAEIVTYEPATSTPPSATTPAGAVRYPARAHACVELLQTTDCFPHSTRDAVLLPLYRARVGSAGLAEGFGLRVIDRMNDENWNQSSAAPALLVAEPKGFALLVFEAYGYAPGMTRVRFELDDFPPEWTDNIDAAIYAASFEVASGVTTVGLYAKKGQAPQAFCQPVDPGVFAKTPQDPQVFDWKTIESEYTQLAPVQGQRVGILSLYAPDACFGVPVEKGIDVRRAGAATFAIMRTDPSKSTGQVYRIDEALRKEPASIQWVGVPAAEAGQTFGIPFGPDNFWDIFGVFSAFAVSVGGFAVFRTRRSSMRRYMRRIDDAQSLYRDDARGLEESLLVIRTDLRRDLMQGHLAEGQYVVVERRLDEHLTRTRIAGLVDSFGELPYRLLVKLEQLLADGHMSREDYRNFVAMLKDSHLPSAQQSKIRSKLGHWVRQDVA
ncbi:MAG: hypothetical protein HYT80_04470 [Euryarchaeota archaeon]|nr:hypothetical protein [Euryarchaeota archaeon]